MEVLKACETEQPPQTLDFTKNRWTQNLPWVDVTMSQRDGPKTLRNPFFVLRYYKKFSRHINFTNFAIQKQHVKLKWREQ